MRLPIALCVGNWLPPSETFIYDQLLHQRRTAAWVLARGKTRFAQRFPYDDLLTLGLFEQLGFLHAGVAPTVTRALESRHPSVIHAHFGLNGASILPFARRLSIPLVVSFHGHDVGGFEPQNKYALRYFRYQRLRTDLFDYASRLLCASTELADLLESHGAPRQKLFVHHLGIDTERFSAPSPSDEATHSEPRLLMVGRLVEKKGMEFGILAFARLAAKYPSARLVIVGDGPLRRSLRRSARGLDVGERVEFLGAQSSEQVRQEMQRATLLVTPSVTTASGDRESGVIVLKEAGAMGLPCVATAHGGIPEIVESGKTGLLVPERDVAALTEAIDALLADPQTRARMGRAARELITERYDTRIQNARLEDHLLAVAGSRGRDGS